MNQLFRACYLRNGLPQAITFSAADAQSATLFSERWERNLGVEVLTVKPIPSRFPDSPYKRNHSVLQEEMKFFETSADYGF